MYTVKTLSDLAGVSVRTLHHYDHIDLLKPSQVGRNGYRYYTDEALFRLQQILFYREIGLELGQIRRIIDDPKFDRVSALQEHRRTLQEKVGRLQTLVTTIDRTILHFIGEVTMSNKTIFEGFSEEKQKEYEKQGIEQWGAENVNPSIKRWNSYSDVEKEAIKKEGGAIYQDLVTVIDQGPHSAAAQAILTRWHQHLRYFYEPSLERLRGLGNGYLEHPDFNATFSAMHTELPAFLQQAINHYVDALEKG